MRPPPAASEPPRPLGRQAPAVHVVGFWKRATAAAIDLAIVVPLAMLVVFVVGKLAGVALPQRIGLLDLDMWIDLVLAIDPALVMGLTLLLGIGLVYLLLFHILLGRTLGMRVLRLRVIDVYGDPPSPARCIARCAGYVAGVLTLFLGFLWMGFDSEKRALQDWIAGTYVIRA
ncbi:MAG TPA: RDD family protein [Kofleriaceae bacterium]|nr:RDD family protein [Kofleriaceae bacterium]